MKMPSTPKQKPKPSQHVLDLVRSAKARLAVNRNGKFSGKENHETGNPGASTRYVSTTTTRQQPALIRRRFRINRQETASVPLEILPSFGNRYRGTPFSCGTADPVDVFVRCFSQLRKNRRQLPLIVIICSNGLGTQSSNTIFQSARIHKHHPVQFLAKTGWVRCHRATQSYSLKAKSLHFHTTPQQTVPQTKPVVGYGYDAKPAGVE
jgi:hypothetical protein